jgi:hypothetical protein
VTDRRNGRATISQGDPRTEVVLYIYAKRASRKDARNFVMEYCGDRGKCVDEADSDRDLATQVDRRKNVVFRRIKHFSGYVVAERGSSDEAFGLAGF